MDKLVSRKLIVTLVYALLVALNDKIGLKMSEDALLGLAAVCGAYLAAQGWIDAKEKETP